MNKIALAVVALSSLAAFGETTNQEELVKFGSKMVTREYRRNAICRALLARTGGHVRKENSASGWFVVINAQKAVNQAEIDKALSVLDAQVNLQAKSVSGEAITLENVKAKIVGAGGALGVAVIDGGNTPALLTAPEEGWAIVNVARLSVDKPDSEKLAARVRREVMRGFAFIAGDMSAAYGETLMQPITDVKGIDAIPHEEFAAALLNTFPVTLPRVGITPWYQRTYVKALEEGWAPPPKDKYQKALWDKVHAMPTEPIKIKPETKKVEK